MNKSLGVIHLLALLTFTSCVTQRPERSLSPKERQLVGTWEVPETIMEVYVNGVKTRSMTSKEVMQITFTPDHNELWSHSGQPPHAIARWHLEGDDLVFTFISQPKDMHLPGQRREKIVRVTATELVFTNGTNEGRWTRVR